MLDHVRRPYRLRTREPSVYVILNTGDGAELFATAKRCIAESSYKMPQTMELLRVTRVRVKWRKRLVVRSSVLIARRVVTSRRVWFDVVICASSTKHVTHNEAAVECVIHVYNTKKACYSEFPNVFFECWALSQDVSMFIYCRYKSVLLLCVVLLTSVSQSIWRWTVVLITKEWLRRDVEGRGYGQINAVRRNLPAGDRRKPRNLTSGTQCCRLDLNRPPAEYWSLPG
jgi:hypothetical protein